MILLLCVWVVPLAARALPAGGDDEVQRAIAGPASDHSSDHAEEIRLGAGQVLPAASPAPTVLVIRGFGVFPVAAAASFSDTFGAPRPGGRTHAGIDIFAPKLTPILAVADGVVVKAEHTSGLSGIEVVVEHSDGSRSFYIHLNNDTPGTDDGMGEGIAPGIAPGVAVTAGTVVGFLGDSGNAEETPPHLHFEYHPAGSGAIDPFTLLEAAQRGEVGVLDLQTLPYTGAPHQDGLLLTAAALILLGLLMIWRDEDLELVITRTTPPVSLAVQLMLWSPRLLERLMAKPSSGQPGDS